MHKMKFKRFLSGDYPDRWEMDGDLYLLRNRKIVLYIGIAKAGIWYRWFGGPRSHMWQGLEGGGVERSPIGEYIYKSWPKSGEWTIEFWSIGDCKKLLRKKGAFDKFGNDETNWIPRMKIKDVEPYMIKLYKPQYNRTFNG